MISKSISIVLPVYKQADHLNSVIENYIQELNKDFDNFEMILVVNSFSDDSLRIAKELVEKHSCIKVKESQRSGWGHAVKLGLESSSGDLICYTNSARTSAKELSTLLKYANNNPETIIKANRKNRENKWRQIGSILYNLECRYLFNIYTWDINGTPKIFPKKFSNLLELQSDDDLIDAEFNILCHRNNYPILEIPVFSSQRYSGRTTTNLLSAIKMYWGLLKLRKVLGE